MRKIILSAVILPVLGLVLASCSGGGGGGGPERTGTFRLTITGIPDLRNTGHYQAWVIFPDPGAPQDPSRNLPPVSLGKFAVRGSGLTAIVEDPFTRVRYGTLESFELPTVGVPPPQESVAFFVTFEHADDRDAVPSLHRFLFASLSGGQGVLTVAPPPGEGGPGIADFGPTTTFGRFCLFTPTDDEPGSKEPGSAAEESLGIWFVEEPFLSAEPALELPELPAGWIYEGWVALGDSSLASLGRFRDEKSVDADSATFGGRGEFNNGPRAPGQDFINEAMLPGQMPLDLTAQPTRVRITVEPEPDNAPAPFQLQLLALEIPVDAVDMDGISNLSPVLESTVLETPTGRATVFSNGIEGAVNLTASRLQDLTLGLANDRGETDPNANVGVYELFAILGGVPSSVARFEVRGTGDAAIVTSEDGLRTFGNLIQSTFPARTDVIQASEILISIEPDLVTDGVPSPSILLRGQVLGGAANLTVGNAITDLRGAAGSFFLDTPTDDLTNLTPNDAFGIWFNRLTLAPLPAGWIYEGWVEEVGGGFRLSTGRFRQPFAPDLNRYTSRTRGPDGFGFFFPGEDFVTASSDISFSIEGDLGLRGGTVFITVEPEPDNSLRPFFLQPLTGPIPLDIFDPNGVNTGARAIGNSFLSLPFGAVEPKMDPVP